MKPHHIALSAAALTPFALPAVAESDPWQLLNQITVDEIVTETSYAVQKTYPSALSEGAIEVEITGYAVPRLPGDMVQDLILMSDMGNCPLCGSFDHGTNLQVLLSEAMPAFDEGTRVSFVGTLTPVTDPETWQTVILKDARVITR
ncbi:hypothetical protein KUD11_13640 [Roseovarius sp. LXJ103]|uniref:hypothetical protein n=1 Tax=Roseovarius carneus TaxID=2853164 RepID=UPI000D61BA3A|nr:hypothetical protein [Roseovarius carneus]MBZ8119686.1 hypothetical protein [Roseovarius carneus]PWE34701.1 hypothetical protein DD563_01105 [Pelagicola sp. LXJ1103]